MSFCQNYTVMEVKQLMLESEGKGPGKTGGHAIAAHGSDRVDVTDRGKNKDSAFKRGWEIITASGVKSMVHSSDQYLAVCNALNSVEGQKKLKKLDALPEGKQVSIDAAVSTANLIPTVRQGSGKSASEIPFKKIHIEIYNVGGRLHIHTAYSV